MWVLEHESNNTDTNLEGGEGLCDINNGKMSETATSLSSSREVSNASSQQKQISPLQYGDEGGWRLLRLLERELVHPTTFTQTFLQSILSSIESRDPVVSNAWLETLLDVIDLLPADVIRNEILNVAISKGQLSQPVASRVACCKLLGKIASKFEPYLIQQEVLPLLLSLCQDLNAEVRAGVCSQLPSLARGLGPELARPALLPSLVEMVSDEEPIVKLSAVQAVSDMLALLDHESRQQIIVPLVRKLCEGALRSEDAVLLAVARQLGLLCYSLGDQMSGDDRRWFIHAYLQMSQLGAPLAPPVLGPMPDLVPLLDRAELHAECRRLCAFNLPAMMVFGLIAEPEVLRRIFCELASDISQDVRRTIASSLHEVSRLLVAEGHTVRSQLVGLLCDSSEDVLESLVPHLGMTLENLGKAGALNCAEEHSAVLELCRALLHCEEEVSQTNNWRLQTNMLEQLSILTKHVTPDIIFTHFVPRMFCKMHKARPLPCRVTAAKTLLKYLNHLKEEKQRSAVLARLNAEFLRSDSCYSRMMYLRMCPDAMTILNPPFFKQFIFNNVLTLGGDRVANIQLEVCSLLCPLKEILRLPHDRQLLHSLESCVGQLLLSAKDRDVNAALAMAIQQLDKIELPASQHDNKVQETRQVISRTDIGRRSISSAHRLSTMGRSLDAARRSEQDNRTGARLGMGSKPKQNIKPNADTRIPQSSTKPSPASISHVDPSTDEFYIDAGIRITPQQSNSKIPNLQDILHQRNKKSDEKVENIRSRLELNQITSKFQQKNTVKKPENRSITKTSLSRDSSPKPAVTMRNTRPTSATGQRKSLNLERNVTRRSLPPQDRMPTGRRNTVRPQSCLIIEPKDTRKQTSTRSLSQESLPVQQQRIQSRIPKVNSPGTSRSTSPGIEALKYSRGKNDSYNIKSSDITKYNKKTNEIGKNLELRLGNKQRSTPVSRDPSPDIRDIIRKSTRLTQQRRPGPSYTAPSSRGSSPDSALHRLTLAPPRNNMISGRSMPSSPSSPIQGLQPPRQSSVPASPSSPLPSRLPVAARYQYVTPDYG